MTAVWFVETRALGRWQPSLFYGDPPPRKSAEGSKINMRADPVLVPAELRGQPLDIIARALSPDGDLSDVPLDALVELLNTPGNAVLHMRTGRTTQ